MRQQRIPVADSRLRMTTLTRGYLSQIYVLAAMAVSESIAPVYRCRPLKKVEHFEARVQGFGGCYIYAAS